MIAADDGRATHIYRAENSAPSPRLGYEIKGNELYRILTEIEDRGWVLEGIYHSHPHSPAKPSQTDINLAGNWPDAIYLIVSLEDQENPELGAFRLANGEVEEVGLSIS